jgi:hypothetical protein
MPKVRLTTSVCRELEPRGIKVIAGGPDKEWAKVRDPDGNEIVFRDSSWAFLRYSMGWSICCTRHTCREFCQLKVNIADLTTSWWGLLPSACHKWLPFCRIFT